MSKDKNEKVDLNERQGNSAFREGEKGRDKEKNTPDPEDVITTGQAGSVPYYQHYEGKDNE